MKWMQVARRLYIMNGAMVATRDMLLSLRHAIHVSRGGYSCFYLSFCVGGFQYVYVLSHPSAFVVRTCATITLVARVSKQRILFTRENAFQGAHEMHYVHICPAVKVTAGVGHNDLMDGLIPSILTLTLEQ